MKYKMESLEEIREYFKSPYFIWLDALSVQEGSPSEQGPGKGKKRPLVIFLHGYGATEKDIASSYRGLPPEYAALSLRAPMKAGTGYMWFPLRIDEDPAVIGYDVHYAREATRGALNWIKSIAGRYSSVALLGFSMGMAMATNLLRYAPEDFSAIVGLSGLVVDDGEQNEGGTDPEYADDRAEALQVPFFWGRDLGDPVVTESRLEFTRRWLPEHTALEERIYPGIAHSISEEEMKDAAEFLRRRLS